MSRAVYYAAGVRFDGASFWGPPGADLWQLLDRHLLRSDLLSSVWHLPSQPPLFNLYSGMLLHLPVSLQQPVAWLIYALLGLALVLSAYLAMIDLYVSAWIATPVAIAIIVNPANVLYENWYSYALPTAAMLSMSVLCCIRFTRTKKLSWGLGFFLALSVVVLLNSTFQMEWFLIALAIIHIGTLRQWRRVVVAVALPLALVGTWWVNDAVQFGSFTSSSWLGMNFTKTTLSPAPPSLLDRLVKQGRLTPLAKVPPFLPVSTYDPRFVSVPKTGTMALDERTKQDGQLSYNNVAYVAVSKLYLHDDLAFIRAEPSRYAGTVTKAATLWFIPPEQYFGVGTNQRHIARWSHLYDAVVLWEPKIDPLAALIAIGIDHRGPDADQVPYASLAVFVIAVLGAPLVIWRRRRADRALATTLAFMWLTILYSFVSTSLVEFSENNRFRFELGPLPLVTAVVVVTAVVRGPGPGKSDPATGSGQGDQGKVTDQRSQG